MVRIEYWKDGERLLETTRPVIPRAGDHVVISRHPPFKVESVVFDERSYQLVQVNLTDGDL